MLLKMNNKTKSVMMRCIYILLIGAGTYLTISGTPIVGSVLYLTAFAFLTIRSKDKLNTLSIIVIVICCLLIVWIGIVRYL